MKKLNSKKKYYDISPLVSPKIAVYPGDTPFSRQVTLSFQNGDHLELSAIRSTVHLGAHADAPSHYKKGLKGIASRDLGFYFGPCQVVEVKKKRGERIRVKDLRDISIHARRVLLRTNSFPDPNKWNDDFNSYSPELIEYLHAKGVRLIGIDTPSIDPAKSKKLESHQVVAKHDMAVLEGLELKKIKSGSYVLFALPLKLKDCEASPVRALLFETSLAFHGDD